MGIFNTLVCLLCTSAVPIVLAAPIQESNTGLIERKIDLVRRDPHSHPVSPYRRGMRKSRKYSSSVTGTAEGFLQAPIAPDTYTYQSNIVIGGKNFIMDFDTGSEDLWVFAPASESELSGTHDFYDPTLSPTAINANKTWSIEYGDGGISGSAAGSLWLDDVQIAGIDIPNQAVGAATQVTGGWVTNLQDDGLVGLSLAPNTAMGFNTTLQNLAPQLKEPLFTSKLTRPNEEPGFYTFGYIDSDTVGDQTVQYVDVEPDEGEYWFWQFKSEYSVIGGQNISKPGNIAIADTGTTLILLSNDTLALIYSHIGGQYDSGSGQWIFPAAVPMNQYPEVVLPAGGYSVTIAPEDFFYYTDGTWNYGSFQWRGDSDSDYFGDFWLRNVYAVWDLSGPSFGFVQRTPGN
jgi:Eukaryotic aspartyl protease